MRRHAKEGSGEARVSADFRIQVIVIIPSAVCVGGGDVAELRPHPPFCWGKIPTA